MNTLEATVIEIISISEKNGYYYVSYKYDVWGSIREDERRFKYKEDAEKFTIGTVIKV